ncbi:CLUMA_CG005624, isoform A [Clunio marinus]|uniref:CLUMA_CG005624, isoform A n=1 Tax=Clunio marinus TaxID=568069 RepID=A0A1J1HXH6_9DIPT|nr:CLUMA_CG005624, isoform A [Clunio marinus]
MNFKLLRCDENLKRIKIKFSAFMTNVQHVFVYIIIKAEYDGRLILIDFKLFSCIYCLKSVTIAHHDGLLQVSCALFELNGKK